VWIVNGRAAARRTSGDAPAVQPAPKNPL